MKKFYDIPHRVCNAILLPNVTEFCTTKYQDKLIKVAKLFGTSSPKLKTN